METAPNSLNHSDELAVVTLQDVVHQGGLSCTEETGDDGHGKLLRVGDVGHGLGGWGRGLGSKREEK